MTGLSLIIINKNNSHLLNECLKRIFNQNFNFSKLEVLVLDGGSTDDSKKIVNSYEGVSFLDVGYHEDMEARRYVGIEISKNEIVGSIDTDNWIVGQNFLKEMIQPFKDNPNVLGTYTKHYSCSDNISSIDNYYALIGGNDPVAYYLKKNDRLEIGKSNYSKKIGQIVKKNYSYDLIKFNLDYLPVIGGNGFFIRKKIALDYNTLQNPKLFFHTDFNLQILKKNNNLLFGIVNNSIIHNSGHNLFRSLKKRLKYAFSYNVRYKSNRVYNIFDIKSLRDLLNLFIFIIGTITFVETTLRAFYFYYLTKRKEWFLHPIVSFFQFLSYSLFYLLIFLKKIKKNVLKNN